MFTTRHYLVIAVLVMSLIGLAGCGQEKTNDNAANQPTQTEQTAPKQEEPKQSETQNPNVLAKESTEMTFVSSTEAPNGCASCHIKVSADKDYTLAAKLKAKPNHPKVDVKTVADCLKCHKDGAGAFKQLMHKVHYKNDSLFVTNYKASCVNCHKLTAEGQVVVAGLEAKGTKLAEIKVAQVDKAPKGCLDCHVRVNEQKDYSFAAVLKKNPKHPQITFDDFNKCYQCHTGQFALQKVVHPKHLTSAAYKNYGSSCLNCHSMSENGAVTVKGKGSL